MSECGQSTHKYKVGKGIRMVVRDDATIEADLYQKRY